MKRRSFVSGIVAVLLVIGVSGCATSTSSSSHSDRLDIAISSQPTNLDEQTLTGSPTKITMRNVYETLVTTDNDNQVRPVLAKSWTVSKDRKTYTFKLRQGVKFHTGQEMTSGDVVASMNRWIGLYKVAQVSMGEDAHFVGSSDLGV
ncbi:ABC transporter substrate-binding protein [Brevibacterium moorei]|uniref:ABC transporter substrate-binding protein n=1 Tax=Brevibacterium moorei TaxID=2968457 RepID=UPI00211CAA22|nr:ABC transporter substrate-binding protein [Brevibacterium sp. 68QC2CO]